MKRSDLSLSEQIRAARHRAKLTQTELALRAGLDQADISKWETGRTPSARTMKTLAVATGARFFIDGKTDIGP